ncbi:hypothetical protein XELAEV_18034347mg [Xenopus laevis]|uniref:Lipocalin/cytosolic fatty-acid binding domain-containing protein n=1 Tax=Xenopus laevis TaxID=8355 RepID=A0A974CEC5_XENLA|nr:hypothetical protein XELAEV_18034347mg [Xenopus laevis]
MIEELNGRYAFVSQDNMDEYFKALSLNMAFRKIVSLLRPEREFEVNGNHMIVRTLSTFRNYVMDFQLGEEFSEDLRAIDGRMCKTTVTWENGKLVCVQRGDVPNRGWKQWLDGDLLHVELTAKDVVSKQTFRKVS